VWRWGRQCFGSPWPCSLGVGIAPRSQHPLGFLGEVAHGEGIGLGGNGGHPLTTVSHSCVGLWGRRNHPCPTKWGMLGEDPPRAGARTVVKSKVRVISTHRDYQDRGLLNTLSLLRA